MMKDMNNVEGMDNEAGMPDFRDAIMEGHNHYRTLHGSPCLMQSDDLSRSAQDWADVLAERNYLQYSETPGVGENIAILSMNGHTLNGDEVTKFWYNENINHDYENPRWRKDTHHFTQIVWKNSTDFGVGLKKVKDEDRYIVVTHYRPPGNSNLPGEFKKNVQRPQT